MNKKYVIINADDLGMTQRTNKAILSAYRDGYLTSTSLVVTTNALQNALDSVVNDCENLGIGLHLSLSVGKPKANPHKIPDIINSKGYFKNTYSILYYKLLINNKKILEQIHNEFFEQIMFTKKLGIKIDHINSEKHFHMIPDIFKIVVKLAKLFNIPFIRLSCEPGFSVASFKTKLQPYLNTNIIKKGLLNYFSKIDIHNCQEILHNDFFFSSKYTSNMNSEIINSIVESIKPGINEII